MYDLRTSDRVAELLRQLRAFVEESVLPEERRLFAEVRANGGRSAFHPPRSKLLESESRQRGLWNCLVRGHDWGTDFGYLEMAPLAELTGRSSLIPRAINWCGPDHGNIELLIEYGTRAQQDQWLPGLLEAQYGSCFAMTEPSVASSDATNISTSIARHGRDLVINGRKWWISAGDDPRTRVAIVMGVSGGEGSRKGRHTMVLVPMDTPGVSVERSLSVFNYDDAAGEIVFDNVRVPAENILGEEGNGFAMAQERLAPARIYHAMRMVGMAERAVELMVARAKERVAFGKTLSEQGMVERQVGESRIEIEATRMLVLSAAAQIDLNGAKGARGAIAQAKVAAPAMAGRVIDRAIQIHGAAGLSGDTPLAWMYAMARTVRIADGPDEVHLRSIARQEFGR